MGFVLKESVDAADVVELRLWIDEKGLKAEEGAEGATALTFGLRPKWRGQDLRRINDAMYANDERGNTRPQFGTSARKKVICGVVWMRGAEKRDGSAVEKMTEAVYDVLPGWVTADVLARLNELNRDGEPKEGE